MRCYVASELAKQEAGLVVRFVTVAKATDQPVGSTSYLNIDRHHQRVEIGGTWITPAWQRSAINTGGKIPAAASCLRNPGLHPGRVQDRRAQHEVTAGADAHRLPPKKASFATT